MISCRFIDKKKACIIILNMSVNGKKRCAEIREPSALGCERRYEEADNVRPRDFHGETFLR